MTAHHCEQPLTEHALGTLDSEAAAAVDAHLMACAACRVELAELVAAVAELDQAVAPATALDPQPGATERLVIAARRTPQEHASAVAAARRRTPARWVRGMRLGASNLSLAAACVALVAMVVVLGERNERIGEQGDRIASLERRLHDAKGDQVAVLRGASVTTLDTAGAFGDARAQVVLQKDAGVVAFRKVPAPPSGRVWQVWIVEQDEHITSLGVIDSARRAAFLPIPADMDPEAIERFIVTAEPVGGSEGPTAEEVAEATV